MPSLTWALSVATSPRDCDAQTLQARGRGQLALMSSISGECGMPGGAAAYCASKVAVRAYGEGLRYALAAEEASGPLTASHYVAPSECLSLHLRLPMMIVRLPPRVGVCSTAMGCSSL